MSRAPSRIPVKMHKNVALIRTSEPVLAEALPRLGRAARHGAGLLMPISTNSDTGVSGAVTDLRNLMTGGGTLSAQAASTMLQTAGFSGVEAVDLPAGTVMVGRVE